MASDGKITIDIELDDSHVRSDINKVASTIQQGLNANQTKTRVNVTADVSGALGQIRSVRAAANDVNDAKPTVNVRANTDAADTQLDATRNRAQGVDDSDPTVTVRAQTSAAGSQLSDIEARAQSVDDSDPTVTVRAQTSAAGSQLGDIEARAQAVEGSDPTVNVRALASAAEGQLGDVIARAQGVEDSDPTVTVRAQASAAEGQLGDVIARAQSVEDSDPTVTVHAQTSAAGSQLSDVISRAQEVENSDPTVSVDVQPGTSAGELGGIQSLADTLENSDPTVSVDVQPGTSTSDLGELQSAADTLEGTDPTVSVNIDPPGVQGTLEAIRDAASQIDGEHTVTVTADDQTGLSGSSSGDSSGGWKNILKGNLATSVVSGVAGAVKSGVSSAFGSGLGYEYGLAKASTLMPNEADASAFGRRLLEMSTEMGVDVETLTEATYNSLSASQEFGKNGDDMIHYLELATKTAMGGYSDTNTVATAMAKTINAYGGMVTADEVADIMIKTQNKGITDVDKLSASLSAVTPIAASIDMGFDQIGATLAAITANGVETSVATTQTRALLNELNKSGTTANKAMEKALGKGSLKELMDSGLTIMDIVKKMYEGNEDKYSSMFSSSEAYQAALMLVQSEGMFGENLAYMNNGTSVVDQAYGIMSSTTGTLLDKIKNQFKGYGIELFDALAPSIQKLLGVVTSGEFKTFMSTIINKITGFLESDKFMDFVNGLKDAAMFLLDVLTGKKSWGELFGEIGKALQGVFGSLMDMLTDGIIDIANQILAGLPSWLGGGTHIETRAERAEREAREAYINENFGQEGYSFYGPGNRFMISDELKGDDRALIQELIEGIASGTPEVSAMNRAQLESEFKGEYIELNEEEMARVDTAIAQDAAQKATAASQMSVLDQYGIYDTASANRILQGGDESVISEVVAAIQALRENNPDADEWYNRSAADVYEETGSYEAALPYAQLENLLSGTTEGTEALKTAADETATGLEGASESTTTLSENTATASSNMEDAATGMSELADQTTATASIQGRVASNSGRAATNAGNTATNLGTASTNAGKVAGALGSLATKIGSISVPSTSKYAVGLDSVPYDNYPALLHKGEMVLNAAEASAYRFGGSASRGGGGIDAQALAAAMQGLSVEMDGRTVGRLVERSVSREQGTRYNRQARVG